MTLVEYISIHGKKVLNLKPHSHTASLFARVKKGTRPAEVGALAPVFEKSPTELKQNLLKCKQTIQIAIFNVRNYQS